MKKTKCTSCDMELDERSVTFSCPSCGNLIARCSRCKKFTVTYKCACGFAGP